MIKALILSMSLLATSYAVAQEEPPAETTPSQEAGIETTCQIFHSADPQTEEFAAVGEVSDTLTDADDSFIFVNVKVVGDTGVAFYVAKAEEGRTMSFFGLNAKDVNSGYRGLASTSFTGETFLTLGFMDKSDAFIAFCK